MESVWNKSTSEEIQRTINGEPKKLKRTISLEAYIKMQMRYLTFLGSSLPVNADLIHAKAVADKILKFNNVEVEGSRS